MKQSMNMEIVSAFPKQRNNSNVWPWDHQHQWQ